MNKIVDKTLRILDEVSNKFDRLLQFGNLRNSAKEDKLIGELINEEIVGSIKDILPGFEKLNLSAVSRFFANISILQYPLGRCKIDFDRDLPTVADFKSIDILLFNCCGLSDYEVAYITDMILNYNHLLFSHLDEESVAYMPSAFSKHGIDPKRASILLDIYFNDKEHMPEGFVNIVEEVISEEGKRSKLEIQKYERIHNFISSKNHTDEEYEDFKEELVNIGFPERLQNVYVDFLKSKDQKEEKEEVKKEVKVEKNENVKPQIPKRVLKSRLKELVEVETFDFENIDEVLVLLKQLEYPDLKKIEVINTLYQKAEKNSTYYRYVLEKAKYMRAYTESIKELGELDQMYESADDNNKSEINEWKDEIYHEIENILPIESDYEMHRLRYVYNEKKEN